MPSLPKPFSWFGREITVSIIVMAAACVAALLSLFTAALPIGLPLFVVVVSTCLYFGHTKVTYKQQGVKDYVRERAIMPIWAVFLLFLAGLPFVYWLFVNAIVLAIAVLAVLGFFSFKYYKTRMDRAG